MLDLQEQLLERQKKKLIDEIEQLTQSKSKQMTQYQQDVGGLRQEKSALLVQVESLKKEVHLLETKQESVGQSIGIFGHEQMDPLFEKLKLERNQINEQRKIVEDIKQLLIDKSAQLRELEIKLNQYELDLNKRKSELDQRESDLISRENQINNKV